jgi:hypothetical protein
MYLLKRYYIHTFEITKKNMTFVLFQLVTPTLVHVIPLDEELLHHTYAQRMISSLRSLMACNEDISKSLAIVTTYPS